MAGDETPQEPGGPRRRRPPPIIDLPASDVSPPTSPGEPDVAAAASSPQPEPQNPVGPLASDPVWRMFAAVAAGAAVILLAVAALSLFGIIQMRDAASPDIAARLAKIEAAQTSRTGAASVQPSDDIASRLTKLETAQGTPTPAATDATSSARIGALETVIKTIGDAVAALNSRAEDSAAALREVRTHIDAAEKANSEMRMLVERQHEGASDKSELDRLTGRITTLESATRTMQQEIDPRARTTTDSAARRALLASALREKVLRGGPFATELSALKALDETAGLSALERFAARGVPAADALASELTALLPKLGATPEPSRPGNLLERLQVNASQLVKIRPIGEAPGDDSKAAILGRAEAKAARADIDGALADIMRLPAATRAPAADWIAKAQARQTALAAAQSLAADALGALVQTVLRP